MPNIDLALVICNPGADRENIVASTFKCGLSPICCSNLDEARFLLPQAEYRVLLCSEALRDGDFRAVIRELHQLNLHVPVIVFGRSYDWDSYLKALAVGASDYVVCPPNPIEVERILWLALADTIGAGQASAAAA